MPAALAATPLHTRPVVSPADCRHSPVLVLARAAPWVGVLGVLGLILLLVVRSCGYEAGPLFRYLAYHLFHVGLPGVVALQALHRGPVGLTTAIALGIPTGHALEILAFLGLAAAGLRHVVPWLPLAWLAAAVVVAVRRRQAPLRCRWTSRHAGVALALAVLFLCTAASAVTQMFAESPLVGGLPQRPIFHDWVYLVSRAAAIKHHWPLEDPSLAGAPLQYHYFMLVHAASASTVTQLEVTQVLLRFVIVPLGGVLVVQAFALGRLVSRSPWGGVLAALMTVAVGELSFSVEYSRPEFLGLFNRWLYVSPTFYFGMIYFGALLLGVALAGERGRIGTREAVWLALLAAAGTGAKGTMTPVLLVALAGWAAWTWFRERRVPVPMVVIGLALSAGFLAVYIAIMSSWGTGQATIEPFRILQLTGFWKDHAAVIERTLAGWLPAAVAGELALGICGAVVFAGTAGVRLLALGQFTRGTRSAGAWLAAVFGSAALMGLMIHLHAYGELYLFLLIPLPMAVLAAAVVVSGLRSFRRARRVEGSPAAIRRRRLPRLVFAGIAGGGIALTLAVQCGAWVARHQAGWAEWLKQSPHMRMRDEMATLSEAMLWVRRHTEPNAVLVANAFTPKRLQHGRGELVDHTTAGVHFYYSALSERRLYVEGPTYLQDGAEVSRRLAAAAEIFHGNGVSLPGLPDAAPVYAVIDRSLDDGAKVAVPERHRVFANARFEIYQLSREPPTPAASQALAFLVHD